MIASVIVVPAVAVMLICPPGTVAQREAVPMQVRNYGTNTVVRQTFNIQVTGLRISSHGAVSSTGTAPRALTLEEAFAEWADESLDMANEMWHHGATDTRDA